MSEIAKAIDWPEASAKVMDRNEITMEFVEETSNSKILRQSKSTSVAKVDQKSNQNTNCITRDNQTVFDKKKLRMQKIQQMRGISVGPSSTDIPLDSESL